MSPTPPCGRYFGLELTQGKCNAIHKTIVDEFRAAIVYGRSVKHQGMRVGLTHVLADEDISEYSFSQKWPVVFGDADDLDQLQLLSGEVSKTYDGARKVRYRICFFRWYQG